jgi:hypothetical protein
MASRVYRSSSYILIHYFLLPLIEASFPILSMDLSLFRLTKTSEDGKIPNFDPFQGRSRNPTISKTTNEIARIADFSLIATESF